MRKCLLIHHELLHSEIGILSELIFFHWTIISMSVGASLIQLYYSQPLLKFFWKLFSGKGFEAFKQPIFVTASLNGHKLNSDAINPSSNPYFGTDLVWEAEKKTVKRWVSKSN